jgi:hypothetical protein
MITLHIVGDAAAFEPTYRSAGNQQDNLCGAYWAHLASRAFAGSTEPDEQAGALAAGVAVPSTPTDPAVSHPWGGGDGLVRATWPYRLNFPTSDIDEEVGCSPSGVIRALAAESHDSLIAVPLRHERWTPELVVGLIMKLADLGPIPLLAVANISTAPLAGSLGVGMSEALAALLHGTPLRTADEPDWEVGHFCSLAAVAHGPADSLVAVRDTYKPMGMGGVHVQTPASVAEGLHRDGSERGGVMVMTRPEHRQDVSRIGSQLGLIEAVWSNGSPD